MSWKLDNDRPIYIQLLEQLINKIVSGEYSPGEKLPSVRDLASEAAVNPNTMQRAFAELESKGLVTTQRTAGRTITTDTVVIENQRTELLQTHGRLYLLSAKSLGVNKEQSIELLKQIEI